MSNYEDELIREINSGRVKDRGSKKWSTSMMLIEHVATLKKWKEEENYIPKPQLAEWELEDLQHNMKVGLKSKLELEYIIWTDGRLVMHRGVITRIDLDTQQFYYIDPFDKQRGPYSLDDVVKINSIAFCEIL
ncbi:YolD-like family protein [Rummeliibacillus suwonensis]|jgi:hypothetical protein|uniref:YolD-like family protein n=1 Tax=Rummeliibacillus suwonensis TaxID=1306154 RepID=UPI0011B68E42|nr:YolD-like family protein [Rummeliibacillus suwonensis]